jgi:gentisate 1,2-dioxygenase
MATTPHTGDGDARRALKAELARYNCRVAQPDDPPVFTREPRPGMQSLHWRGSDLMPLLERLGREVDLGAGGPRRTLRLHDPGLPHGTTNTFWASIQVILPGEVATAHRHSANAFRFVIQGSGAWTTVDGERYPMNEGDLVLTPAGTWHDHVHEGSEPMIWLDVLDISLMQALQATFFEPYAGATQPVDAVPDRTLRQFGSGLMRPPGAAVAAGRNPLLAYAAPMARAALDQAAGLPPDPFDDVALEYRNPVDGGPAMRTMAMQLQRLRPGFAGRARRHTGSKLYYVVEGEGCTTVGDQCFDWRRGDYFTVAPWTWHAHRNASARLATLFQVNDTPVLKALGYYREEFAPATESAA